MLKGFASVSAALAAFGVLTAFATSVLAGPDVQACLAASEKGQKARTAGKLREAREYFITCGNEACPAIVRHDCAQWNSELASTLPTVVFGAKDNQGRDLFDVSVMMDGEPVVKKLDGKSVTVDPGKHTFRFETAGFPAVTETVLIKEGERARIFNITFSSGDTPPKVPPHPPDPDPSPGGGGHTPYPWIVVGVGAVGMAVGAAIIFTTPDRPSNCNESTQKCTRLQNESEADFRKDQERAGTADSQPLLGFVVAGAGLALVAGGLVWHFLEPTNENKRSGGALKKNNDFHITPFTIGQTSGLVVGGSF